MTTDGPRTLSTAAKFVHDTDPILLTEYAVLASLPALALPRMSDALVTAARGYGGDLRPVQVITSARSSVCVALGVCNMERE